MSGAPQPKNVSKVAVGEYLGCRQEKALYALGIDIWRSQNFAAPSRLSKRFVHLSRRFAPQGPTFAGLQSLPFYGRLTNIWYLNYVRNCFFLFVGYYVALVVHSIAFSTFLNAVAVLFIVRIAHYSGEFGRHIWDIIEVCYDPGAVRVAWVDGIFFYSGPYSLLSSFLVSWVASYSIRLYRRDFTVNQMRPTWSARS